MVDQKWIYCKHQKPKESGHYITLYKEYFTPDHVDMHNYKYSIGVRYYSMEFDEWFWDVTVIAWLPLPEMPKRYMNINERFLREDYPLDTSDGGNKNE